MLRTLSVLSIIFVFHFFVLMSEDVSAQIDLCEIRIVKQAFPADDTGFEFIVEGIGNNFDNTLMDPSDNEFRIFISVPNGATTAVENVPDGWNLDGIECTDVEDVTISDVPNGKEFVCNANEGFARCTFTNSIAPRNVPTLSQWGLITMAGILGIVGFMVIRRKQAAA